MFTINYFMRGINKVTLIGNVGKDPEVNVLEGNICVTKFSLATTEFFKDHKGQSNATTEWHTIVLWRSLAELAAKYLHKGSLVYIEGKLKTRRFEDKEGKTRYTTEIMAEQLIMLDKKPEENVSR